MEEASARLGRPVTKQLVVMDLKALNYWPDPRAISLFREFLRILQDYYPETLGMLFFVNAPLLFAGCASIPYNYVDLLDIGMDVAT